MATILKITDSDGSLNLMDNTNYRLRRGWTPKIAGRRRGPWTSGCPYEDVMESITIDILGTTAAEALENLEALLHKLELAERWIDGEVTSGGAVYLEYKPNGSGLTNTPICLILGRELDATSGAMLDLSPAFNEVGGRFEIMDVELKIWRQGWFVEPAAGEESKTSSLTTNPDVYTITFDDDALTFSPLRLSWDEMQDILGGFLGRGIIAITTDADYIQLCEGEDALAGDGTQADTADSNGASGGNVNRLTTSAGVSTFDMSWSPSNVNMSSNAAACGAAGEVAFIMACRNRNTVNSWTAQATITIDDARVVDLETVIVPPSADTNYDPQYIHLGTVSTDGVDLERLTLTIVSPVEDGGTFDVDFVAIVGLPNEASRILALTEETDWNAPSYLVIDHKLMTRRTPYIGGADPTIDDNLIYLAHRGDPLLVTGGASGTSARQVTAAIFVNTGIRYGLYGALGGTHQTEHQMTAKRRKAYLVPK